MAAFIKMQARIRGMLARKDYQKVRAEMNIHGGMHYEADTMVINYDNERVANIRQQLGHFDYSTPGITGISHNVEHRPVQTLPDN
jgi:calcineurin-like phosphoesterase family protein